VRLQDVHKSFRGFAEGMKEKELLRILRRLDEIERENPELYQKIMFGPHGSDVNITAIAVMEKKERCRCDL